MRLGAIVILMLSLFGSSIAKACQPMPFPYGNARFADVVVVGDVVDYKADLVEFVRVQLPHPSRWWSTLNYWWYIGIVEIAVIETLKGDVRRTWKFVFLSRTKVRCAPSLAPWKTSFNRRCRSETTILPESADVV